MLPMADVIVGQFGKEANDAWRKNRQAPVLSGQAINFIKVLESRYAKNKI